MNRNLSNCLCSALFAAFTATVACGGDDGEAMQNPLSPSAAGGGSTMAEASGAGAQPASYPTAPTAGFSGATIAGTVERPSQQCTAPSEGQHWVQLRNRPMTGGVGVIRNRITLTFQGQDTLTRSDVCELARLHLGNSRPWCGTVGHTADWEASYVELDRLETCREGAQVDDVVRLTPQSPQWTTGGSTQGRFTLNILVQMSGNPPSMSFFSIQTTLDGPGVGGKIVGLRTTYSPADSVGARFFNVPLDCSLGAATATFTAVSGTHERHLNPPQVQVVDPVVQLCS